MHHLSVNYFCDKHWMSLKETICICPNTYWIDWNFSFWDIPKMSKHIKKDASKILFLQISPELQSSGLLCPVLKWNWCINNPLPFCVLFPNLELCMSSRLQLSAHPIYLCFSLLYIFRGKHALIRPCKIVCHSVYHCTKILWVGHAD